jgi:hypothetical protein
MTRSKRDSDCCWICRLRRKKCDRSRPICGGCQSLNITCHQNEQRPDWMDGGDKQRCMRESLKNRIRRNAEHRKEQAADFADVNGGLNFIVELRCGTSSSQIGSKSDDEVDRLNLSTQSSPSYTGLNTLFTGHPASMKTRPLWNTLRQPFSRSTWMMCFPSCPHSIDRVSWKPEDAGSDPICNTAMLHGMPL